MPHLDEGTIHAWLDGALSPDESARAETHVAECATCAAAVAEARGLIAASSRILTALDDAPGEVVPSTGRLASPRRSRFWATRYARIAAAIAVVGLGLVVVRESRDLRVSAPRTAESTLAMDSMAAGRAEVVTQPAEVPEIAASPAPSSSGAGGLERAPAPEPSAQVRGTIAAARAERPTADKALADAAAAAPEEERQKRDTTVSNRQDYAAAPPPPAPRTMIAPSRAGARVRMRGVEADSRAQLAQINGRVTDSAGAPISSASVTVVGTTSGDLTRADGSFQIANVPAGTQTVEAKRTGYGAAREQVSANAGDTISVNLALRSGLQQLSDVVVTGAGAATAAAANADTTEDREIAGLTLLNTSESVVDGRPVRRSLYQLRPGVTLTLVERRARVDESGAPAATSPQGLSLPRRQAADERRRLDEQRRAAKEAPVQINTITWTSTDGTEFTLTGAVAVVELEDVRRKIEQR